MSSSRLHIVFKSSLLCILLITAGCAKNELSSNPESGGEDALENYITCNATISDNYSTKGSLATAVPNQFRAWGYIKLQDDGVEAYQRPNYMVGETFEKLDETTWQSVHYFGPVPINYKVKYWGLAGDGSAASSLPTSSSGATPSFTYTLPTEVASQTDLLTGWSTEVNGTLRGMRPKRARARP